MRRQGSERRTTPARIRCRAQTRGPCARIPWRSRTRHVSSPALRTHRRGPPGLVPHPALAWTRRVNQFRTRQATAFIVDMGLFNLLQHGALGVLAEATPTPRNSSPGRDRATLYSVDRQPPVDLRGRAGAPAKPSSSSSPATHLRHRHLTVLPAVHARHPGTHLGAGRQHRRLRRRICARHLIPILLLSLRGLHRTYARRFDARR